MKEYEIWIEGYAITGNSAEASFIGKAFGETFEDACRNFEYPETKIIDYGMETYNGRYATAYTKGDK